jgi:hypothetical protein
MNLAKGEINLGQAKQAQQIARGKFENRNI